MLAIEEFSLLGFDAGASAGDLGGAQNRAVVFFLACKRALSCVRGANRVSRVPKVGIFTRAGARIGAHDPRPMPLLKNFMVFCFFSCARGTPD